MGVMGNNLSFGIFIFFYSDGEIIEMTASLTATDEWHMGVLGASCWHGFGPLVTPEGVSD